MWDEIEDAHKSGPCPECSKIDLAAILAYHKQAKAQLAELRTIISNVASALYPNSTKQQQLAEMLLDGGGAVDTITTLREIRRAAEDLIACADCWEDRTFPGSMANSIKCLRTALGVNR
jgi:hypothetical protein